MTGGLGLVLFSIIMTFLFMIYYFLFDKIKEICQEISMTPKKNNIKIKKEKEYGEGTDNEFMTLISSYEMV